MFSKESWQILIISRLENVSILIGQLEVGALISYEKQDVGLRGKSVFLKNL